MLQKFVLQILDSIFLTRPVLWIPVWGFSVLGCYRAGGEPSLLRLWRSPVAADFFWMMVFSCSAGAVYVINQIADREVDAANDGFPLLVKGNFSKASVLATVVCAAGVSLVLPLAKYPAVSLFSLAALIIGALYCAKPFFFAGRPVLDFLSNAVGYGIVAFGCGWYLAGASTPIVSLAFFRSGLPYFLLMCAGSISSTIPDISGDAAGKKITTAVALGPVRAHALATGCIVAAGGSAWSSCDLVALVCAAVSLPLYIAFFVKRTRMFMEATYKIGGALLMLAAGIICPLFAAVALAVFVCTWIYFRFRHHTRYPALVPARVKTRTLIVPIVFLLALRPASAYTLNERHRYVAERVNSLAINCEFDKGLKLVDSLVAANGPDGLMSYMRLSILGLRDMDYDCPPDTGKFLTSYRAAMSQTERKTAIFDSALTLTIRGSTQATYSAYCLRQKKYSAGIDAGLDALKVLKEAKQIDPNAVDADFVLGLYDCARATLKKRLWWVLFWYPGNSNAGISRLETCAERGTFAAVGARLALIDIYAEEKQIAPARDMLNRLQKTYPASRFVLWSKARLHEGLKEFSQAAAAYGQLADSYDTIPTARRSAAASRCNQAAMLDRDRRYTESAGICRKLIARFDHDRDPEIKGYVKEAKELLKKAEDSGLH